MRSFFSLLCTLPLLVSCALPSSVFLSREMKGKGAPPGRLLEIRIERGDVLRFAGLLGVRETESGLDYVLLDATGVKLLEAQVTGDGDYLLLQDDGPLRQSGLPPFLSESLARIYLQEPDRLPCTGSWWYRLCREQGEDGSSLKYGQAGPFTVWKISGRDLGGSAETGDGAIVYHQPWLGVTIRLKRMGTEK